jgi:hypothetical protein
MLTVDGYPAVELFYRSKMIIALSSSVRPLFYWTQRQPKKTGELCGDLSGEFNERHQQQYQEIIQSIKFHRGK